MATIVKGKTFGATEEVTAAKLHQLVDSATISGIVNADIDAAAGIEDTKLATINDAGKVDGGALTGLANIPSGAGVIPVANVPSLGVATDGTVNPTNLLSNGDFESWSAGASAAPDGWTLAGAGAVTGKETTPAVVKVGASSVLLQRNTNNCSLEANAFGSATSLKVGVTLTFSCWVYAGAANRARISLGTNNSAYHTGDGTWQLLTVSGVVTAATGGYNICYLRVDNGDATAYFDGAICVEGSSAFAFSPKPAEEGVEADYFASSTITGWAATPAGKILVKKIGTRVFVRYQISGTSDQVYARFTLPYTAKNDLQVISCGFCQDASASVSTASYINLQPNTNIVNLYKDMAGTTFTAAGNKLVAGQFFYEAA